MASGFLVEKDYTTPSGVLARDVAAPRNAGAGDGDRTHIASLEGWSSAIELHPHSTHRLDPCDRAAIPTRWRWGEDSNLRRRTSADLQSAAFNRSATPPGSRGARRSGWGGDRVSPQICQSGLCQMGLVQRGGACYSGGAQAMKR